MFKKMKGFGRASTVFDRLGSFEDGELWPDISPVWG